jgi:riboflavin kinase/FMN adenylyltransferase
VYIVQAEVEQETYQGMMNIGYRPTVNGLGLRLEVHLLDVSLDLYDKNLTVRFLSSIRSEEKFPSLEALKTQLSKDKETTRAFFSGR